MSKLNDNEYKKILEYYKKSIPKTKQLRKIAAEDILAGKLCRCIKKVDPINEPRSIAICTKTIFNRKHYIRGTFKCKGKKIVTFRKSNSKNKTKKH